MYAKFQLNPEWLRFWLQMSSWDFGTLIFGFSAFELVWIQIFKSISHLLPVKWSVENDLPEYRRSCSNTTQEDRSQCERLETFTILWHVSLPTNDPHPTHGFVPPSLYEENWRKWQNQKCKNYTLVTNMFIWVKLKKMEKIRSVKT